MTKKDFDEIVRKIWDEGYGEKGNQAILESHLKTLNDALTEDEKGVLHWVNNCYNRKDDCSRSDALQSLIDIGFVIEEQHMVDGPFWLRLNPDTKIGILIVFVDKPEKTDLQKRSFNK